MTELNVFLHGKKAGVLYRPDVRRPLKIYFSYGDEYDGPPLSLSMPTKQRHYDEDVSYAFFQNLLPENLLLKEICRQRHIASDDLLACLGELGKETAGAIVIIREDAPPKANGVYRDITDIVRHSSSGFLAVAAKIRLSLAGAQDKIAAVVKDGRVFVPEGYSPTTHILKPDSSLFPKLVYNEAICLDIAKQSELNVPDHYVTEFGDRPFLVIKRYDRMLDDGNIIRLHQEDFCQAMGVYGSGKYQRSGLYEGVSEIVTTGEKAGIDIRREVADFMLFSFIIGNMDAHAKNISMLYQKDSRASFAPLYDIVCTEVYPDLDNEMAMTIGRSYVKENISENDISIFADDVRLSREYVKERFRTLAECSVKACHNILKEQTYPEDIARKIFDIVTHNAKKAMDIVNV